MMIRKSILKIMSFFRDSSRSVLSSGENLQKIQKNPEDKLLTLKTAGIMIWEWNSKSQIFRWIGSQPDMPGTQACITEDPIEFYFSTIPAESRKFLSDLARERFQYSDMFRAEYHITGQNENSICMEITILAYKDRQGRIDRYIGINIDITNIQRFKEEIQDLNKNLEQIVQERTLELQKANENLQKTLENLTKTQNQLILTEKMAALGQLISGIAHEINNPIGTIQASVELIRSQKNPIFWDYQKSNFMWSLDRELRSIAEDFFLYAMQLKDIPTGIRRRHIQNSLLQELKPYSFGSKSYFVERCMDIGIQTFPDKYKELLSHPQAEEILEYLLNRIFSEKNLESIEVSVQRVANLIKCLKNYSHTDSSRQKILYSVEESLETVLMIFYNKLKKGVELIRNYETVPMILCNPDDLIQLWTNLIQNALQAMNYQGTLELRVYQTSEPPEVNVEVIDSGQGIPESITNRIFEPFFTTKRLGEGSGLGLDISKKIVEEHSGKIDFQSRPGRTVFHVAFPIVEEPKPQILGDK